MLRFLRNLRVVLRVLFLRLPPSAAAAFADAAFAAACFFLKFVSTLLKDSLEAAAFFGSTFPKDSLEAARLAAVSAFRVFLLKIIFNNLAGSFLKYSR